MITKILLIILTTTSKNLQNFTKPEEYCIKSQNSKCTLCINSYLNEETLLCSPPQNQIPHCLFYDSPTTCQRCQYSFTPSLTKKTCEKIQTKNCIYSENEKEDKNQNCLACKFPIMAKFKKCNKKNICEIKNCLACTELYGFNSCDVCEDGFSVRYFDVEREGNIAECVRDFGEVGDCWFLDPFFQGRCFVCRVGFFMDQGFRCWKSSQYDMGLFGIRI